MSSPDYLPSLSSMRLTAPLTFHHFPRLPTELQMLILTFAFMNTSGYAVLHKLKQYNVYANRVSYRKFRPPGSQIALFMGAQWLSIDVTGVITRYKYRDLFDLMGSCRLAREVGLECWRKEIKWNGSGCEYLWMKREKILHVLDGLVKQMR